MSVCVCVFPRVTNGFSSAVPVACGLTDPLMCASECVRGMWYSRPGVVGCMQSPWFILELQCYDPSALAPAPLDRMDKVDYFFSVKVLAFCFTSFRTASACFSYVSYINAVQVMLLSPCFCPAVCSPLYAPSLSFSSCCQCQISKLLKTSTGFPLCLPDLCS